MANSRIMRCYIYRLPPISRPQRDSFIDFCKNLEQFTRDLPEECKGCHFAQVYETWIGSGGGSFYIHFEFGSMAQLDAAMGSPGMRKFHAELQKYLNPNILGESWIMERIV